MDHGPQTADRRPPSAVHRPPSAVHPRTPAAPPLVFRLMMPLMAFTAFFASTKLVPGIANNIGPFEIIGAVFLLLFLIFAGKYRLPLQFHPLIKMVGLIFFIAAISVVQVTDHRLQLSVVGVLILLFMFALLTGLYNLFLLYPSLVKALPQAIIIVGAIIGGWILIEQIQAGYNYGTSGPFRGRGQSAVYILGVFWLVLSAFNWPETPWWRRLLALVALALAVYAIAVSGRRSVYTALIVGMIILLPSFFVLTGRMRFNLTVMVGLTVLFVAFLFVVGSQYWPSLAFFRARAEGLDARLTDAFVSEEDSGDERNFSLLQRQGGIRALTENPFLGIGWNGFARSEYSPTGHEMHSNVWRFAAELGVTGIVLYLLYTGVLLWSAWRLFLKTRASPYGVSTFVLFVGLFSITVSQYYNRMFTDRSYWLVLIVLLGYEVYLAQATDQRPQTTDDRPQTIDRRPSSIVRRPQSIVQQ